MGSQGRAPTHLHDVHRAALLCVRALALVGGVLPLHGTIPVAGKTKVSKGVGGADTLGRSDEGQEEQKRGKQFWCTNEQSRHIPAVIRSLTLCPDGSP